MSPREEATEQQPAKAEEKGKAVPERRARKSLSERFGKRYSITLNEPDSESAVIIFSTIIPAKRLQRRCTQMESSSTDPTNHLHEDSS